jgi:hypothetical protein
MKKTQLLKAKRQKKREAASVVCCQINAAFVFSIHYSAPLAACRLPSWHAALIYTTWQ